MYKNGDHDRPATAFSIAPLWRYDKVGASSLHFAAVRLMDQLSTGVDNHHQEHDSGHSVRVIDKVSGAVDIIVGKMTGNEDKVREGREKKSVEKAAERERAEDAHAHPGISHTKSGAMRQTCLVRSPPSSTQDEEHEEEAVSQVVETTTLPKDDTASIHQHVNYAGPNLTAPPPEHYSPDHDHDHDLTGSESEGQGQEVGTGRLRAYDLHGGFPTGAPSPGGRGAEAFDPFERAGGSTSTSQGGAAISQAR